MLQDQGDEGMLQLQGCSAMRLPLQAQHQGRREEADRRAQGAGEIVDDMGRRRVNGDRRRGRGERCDPSVEGEEVNG